MKSLHRNKKGVSAAVLTELDYSVLNYEKLLAVNGAGGRGSTGGDGAPEGPSSSSSSSSDYSTSGNLSDRGYSNSTEGYDPSAPSDIQVQPRYADQRDFSEKYGETFGNNACAATSLLNEISEQYTRETGHALPAALKDAAMDAAVNSGAVSSTNAYVSDWAGAANAMAEAVGLEGNYTYKN